MFCLYRCKVPIRRSYRYNSIVKKTRAKIESVLGIIAKKERLLKKLQEISTNGGSHYAELEALSREAQQMGLINESKRFLQIASGVITKEVVEAMRKEANHVGHWFTCPNGISINLLFQLFDLICSIYSYI